MYRLCPRDYRQKESMLFIGVVRTVLNDGGDDGGADEGGEGVK